MSEFSPCRGGDFCTQDGSHCQGCGRSHEEIASTRALIERIAHYALEQGYDNLEDFAQYVATKAVGKVRWIQSQPQEGLPIANR